MSYIPGDVILYRYRIEKWLGSAGLGDLYQVTQLSRRARRMLQVVSRTANQVTEESFRQANDEFQAAVRLSAQISHLNLLQVLDSNSNADLLTLLMEDAPGGSLADRMAKSAPGTAAVTTGEAIRLGIQIAEGLQALHGRGYVHGDLQPSNIFLDEQDQVKLGGLGKASIPGYALALFTAPPAADSDYGSPEQKGGARNLSFASDIYALGCILFGLLSGRLYSKQKPVTKVNALALRGPDWLNALVFRMLAPDPRQRPANGAEAAALLRAAGGPVEAPAPAFVFPEILPGELPTGLVEPVHALLEQIPGQLEELPAKIEHAAAAARVKPNTSRDKAPALPLPSRKPVARAPQQRSRVNPGQIIATILFFTLLCLFLYFMR